MQPEAQIARHTSRDWCTIRLIERIVLQMLLVFTAVYITYLAGIHVPPTYRDVSLSPTGVEQSGWPLPWASSNYVEETVRGSVVNSGGFNIIYLIIDIVLVYIVVRFAAFILNHMVHYGVRRYDSSGYVDRYWPYIKFGVLCAIALLILYYVILILFLFIEKPYSVHSGVPIQNAPVQVGR